ncbi:hypothetical protein A2917_03585 [Candidatus Nomurabacteria bacterium RIFCSPLOWO2_01_FULL_42_17]|uniref:Peptidoglycan binding-like domain-containing protein n=1 Tax=Candidatus Nomurabacteria bacterium RIFCSPLOWO2_01_FULL_42_17 TaxID=1801780 RepID=A0A1F6XNA0_9BACT|nr:MAG: hypothetical protein A2917_03585 [Candidatus Nomurabacteria bacterium RIFCSPLOWO2_01_FULL_42_17]
MSNILNLKGVKFFAIIVLAVALLATFGIAAQQASADTVSLSSCPTLRQGSSGDCVMTLQAMLDGGLVSDGKFGPKTALAVSVFQAAHNLTADAVVGPMTKAALMGSVATGNFPAGCTSAAGYSSTTGVKCDTGPSTGLPAGCSTTAGYSPLTGAKCDSSVPATPSGPLAGGAGDITLTLRGTYSGEEVGEGEKNVKVLAVDVEADDDSDVELDSVKVEFFQATTADDRDLPDYASEVSVWLKGVKVGSADTSDFTESSNFFSKSINLDGAIVRAGDEDELVIAVSANSSLDSGDIDTDAWQVDIVSVRFTDASGVTTTESGSAAATAGAGTYGKLFDFASFATANDAELTLSLDDEEINDVHLLDSDDTDDTDHAITSVLFDASGDSDIWVDEVVATITTTGEANESLIVVSTWIEVDGVRISEKETVADAGAITYDDLDYTIDAGDEKEFIFWVTMQNVDGALDEGDTVQLTVTTASTVAEDEAGDTVTAAGSNPVGGVHLLYNDGFRLVGHSQVATAFSTDGVNNDRVELELIFDVFNYGDVTLYIPDGDTFTSTSTSSNVSAPSTTEEVGYHIQTSGTVTPPSAQVSAVLTESDSDLTLKTNSYELKSGKTGTFNLKVTISADENPSIDNVGFRALLTGLGWATSDVATAAVVYTADLGDYKTNYATIAD